MTLTTLLLSFLLAGQSTAPTPPSTQTTADLLTALANVERDVQFFQYMRLKYYSNPSFYFRYSYDLAESLIEQGDIHIALSQPTAARATLTRAASILTAMESQGVAERSVDISVTALANLQTSITRRLDRLDQNTPNLPESLFGGTNRGIGSPAVPVTRAALPGLVGGNVDTTQPQPVVNPEPATRPAQDCTPCPTCDPCEEPTRAEPRLRLDPRILTLRELIIPESRDGAQPSGIPSRPAANPTPHDPESEAPHHEGGPEVSQPETEMADSPPVIRDGETPHLQPETTLPDGETPARSPDVTDILAPNPDDESKGSTFTRIDTPRHFVTPVRLAFANRPEDAVAEVVLEEVAPLTPTQFYDRFLQLNWFGRNGEPLNGRQGLDNDTAGLDVNTFLRWRIVKLVERQAHQGRWIQQRVNETIPPSVFASYFPVDMSVPAPHPLEGTYMITVEDVSYGLTDSLVLVIESRAEPPAPPATEPESTDSETEPVSEPVAPEATPAEPTPTPRPTIAQPMRVILEINDGSRVSGLLLGFSNGSYRFQLDSDGDLNIPVSMVQRIHWTDLVTERSVRVIREDFTELLGEVVVKNEFTVSLRLFTTGQVVQVILADIMFAELLI